MTAEQDDPVYQLPRTMVMRAEFGSDSPFWTMNGRYIELDNVPITPRLKGRICDWTEDLDRVRGDDSSPTAVLEWVELGRSLHAEASKELGPDFRLILDE